MSDIPARFYIKRGPTKWEAWKHGWKFDDDVKPDWHIGDYPNAP